jgi:hypothetical protein
MSVSIEDMKWEAELCREEMEQLSEDKATQRRQAGQAGKHGPR